MWDVPVRIVDAGTDWSAWITAISTALTAVILLVTAVFALSGLRDARRTRHGQLVTDLSRRWDEPLLVEAGELYTEHGPQGLLELVNRLYAPVADPGDTPTLQADLKLFSKLTALPTLIETIGVLEDEDVISAEVVFKMWGPLVARAWDNWREAVVRLREFDDDGTLSSNIYKYFEALAQKMREIEAADS